jgi:hypothetical protein
MALYPCKECIVKGLCSKLCDKVLTENLKEYIVKNRCCPDCGDNECVEFTSIWIYFTCSSCYSLYRLSSSSNPNKIVRHVKAKALYIIRLKGIHTTFGKLVNKYIRRYS